MYISNQCAFPSDWTVADLLKPHRSRPYNPQLASTFYRAGYIESWGRGIEKIETECKTAGAKPPQYEVKGDGFTVKFDAMTTNEVIKEGNGKITLTGNEKLVLEAIKNNQSITKKELANLTTIPSRTIDRIIQSLQGKGLIVRQGSNKTGYWQIIKVA